MSPADLALNGLLSMLLFSAVGVLFGWALRRIAARGSVSAQVGAWLGGAVVVTVLLTMQTRRTQTALGISPEQQSQLPIFWWLLPMWIIAFGAVVLTVRRDIRIGGGRFTIRTTGRILGAFWLGVLTYLLGFAILDIAPLLR